MSNYFPANLASQAGWDGFKECADNEKENCVIKADGIATAPFNNVLQSLLELCKHFGILYS